MSIKSFWLLISLLLILPVWVQADPPDPDDVVGLTLTDGAGSYVSGLTPGISLLNPQRFQMSQSYGLIYSYSSQRSRGDLLGVYQNMLSYRFSPRLDVKVGLGYLHRPVTTLSSSSAIRQQALMTAFELNYRPFNNFFIHFQYQSVPMIDDRDPTWRYRSGWDSLGD